MNQASDATLDSIAIPGTTGRVGLTACPGVRRGFWGAMAAPDADLRRIKAWGAEGVVTLMEMEEMQVLGVGELPGQVERFDMWWLHLPIPDMCAPGPQFEQLWESEGARLRALLVGGGRFVLHCLAGLGRTGTVAGQLLVEFGVPAPGAIERVRTARSGAIQTVEQAQYVMNCMPRDDVLTP